MRSLVRARWALLLLLVALAGCASVRRASPEVVAGIGLDELGATFVAAGTLYNDFKTRGLITEADYEPWRAFATTFKPAYSAAVRAYQAGTTEGDAVRKALGYKAALFGFLKTITAKAGGGT